MSCNLPDGVTIYDLPGCSREDEKLEIILEHLYEELKDTIQQYKYEFPLNNEEIAAVLEDLTPCEVRRYKRGQII